MDAQTNQPNLILTGFMGSGKTTIGRRLAERLNRHFIDTDDLIVTWAGRTVAEIFAEAGEAAFRAWELRAAEALAQPQSLVIATGGGMVTNPACVALLRRGGEIVTLTATPETILARVDQSDRPLLQVSDPAATIAALLTARAAAYGQFPQISTDARDPDAIVEALIERLHLTANV